MIESGSAVSETRAMAPSGTAFADVAMVPVFGVVPAVMPPFREDVPVTLLRVPTAVAGADSTLEDGV